MCLKRVEKTQLLGRKKKDIFYEYDAKWAHKT